MNNKKSLKKTILYISLIPYIFMLPYIATFSFKNITSGFDCITDALANVLEFFVFDYTLIGILMFSLIIFQLYYLISEGKGIVKNIFLVLSLGSWIWYFAFCISRYWLGHTFLFHTTYGLDGVIEALWINLLFFSIIPILPLSLIYITFYSICKLKNGKAMNKDIN